MPVHVDHLECLRCGLNVEWSGQAYLCPACGAGEGPSDAGVLDVVYDYDAARRSLVGPNGLATERRDLFRYLPLLPVDPPGPLPPVGGTPVYEAARLARRYGRAKIYLKDETRNPTRVLKDRATAIAVTRARMHGYEDVLCASAGNAAISLAGLAAFAGVRSHAFVPRDASAVRLNWLERLGADVRRSTGDYDDAYEEAERARANGWYSRNCAFNPFLVEGKKTAGHEIAEQLGWKAPDLVVSPVGDACTLAAIGKGLREMALLGLIERLPRLVGVQSAAVRPLVDMFERRDGGAPSAPAREASTAAVSINVAKPRNARRLLRELALCDGLMLAVDDEQIAAAQAELARDAGLVVEFTSAAALAGLKRLAEREPLDGLTAVLMITGGRPDDA
jgi:threonine synthase